MNVTFLGTGLKLLQRKRTECQDQGKSADHFAKICAAIKLAFFQQRFYFSTAIANVAVSFCKIG